MIKDDNLFERFHTVIDEAGPIHFIRFFLLEYLLCHRLSINLYDLHSQKHQIQVCGKATKEFKPFSEYFASLFADLN